MKIKGIVLGVLVVLSAQVSYAQTSTYGGSYGTGYYNPTIGRINDAQSLLRYQNRMNGIFNRNSGNQVAQDIRLKSIYDYAKSIAIRAAINNGIEDFNDVIRSNERNLDAIYNFQPLMIANKVVPPVITEARNLYNQAGRDQIRTSDAIYQIDKQAYFSSTPPNWRAYLNFRNEGAAYDSWTYVGGDLTPKNGLERKVWDNGTYDGWRLGSEEAKKIMQSFMERLNKDYIGMVRFHELVLAGKITMPSISSYNLYDTNTGDKLILGEELLKIQSLPQFKNYSIRPRTAINIVNNDNYPANSIRPNKTKPALVDKPTDQAIAMVQNVRDGKPIVESNEVRSAPINTTPNPLSLKDVPPSTIDTMGQKMLDSHTRKAVEEAIRNGGVIGADGSVYYPTNPATVTPNVDNSKLKQPVILVDAPVNSLDMN